jgi:hypothetical protein
VRTPVRYRSVTFLVIVLVSAAGIGHSVGHAQDQATPPGAAAPTFKKLGPITPLKVQIVVARYQGDKKVSSVPYTLAINANDGFIVPTGEFLPNGGPARLRTGASIPIRSLAVPKEVSDLTGVGPVGPVSYKDIGTKIDCVAHSTDDGRYRVRISIEDTSVHSDGQTAAGAPKLDDIPSIRTFQSSNTVILKDGESTQFSSWADKISGDITKVDVTLTVTK